MTAIMPGESWVGDRTDQSLIKGVVRDLIGIQPDYCVSGYFDAPDRDDLVPCVATFESSLHPLRLITDFDGRRVAYDVGVRGVANSSIPTVNIIDLDTSPDKSRRPSEGEVQFFMGVMEFFDTTLIPELRAAEARREAARRSKKSGIIRRLLG